MLNSSNKQRYSARQVVITQCAGGFQRGQATVEGPCLLLPGAVNFCDRTSSAATTRLTTVSLQRRSRLLGRAHPQQTSPHHNTARSHMKPSQVWRAAGCVSSVSLCRVAHSTRRESTPRWRFHKLAAVSHQPAVAVLLVHV